MNHIDPDHITNVESSSNSDGETIDGEYVVYKRRWLILTMFVLFSLSNGFNWLDIVIIDNVIEKFYGVNSVAVTWTSMIYMAVYIPLIFPATWFLQRRGLRESIILGASLNCIGSWIKCGSTYNGAWNFAVLFIGQTICAIAQVFVLNIPTEIAAIWFPASQVSTACAIGVFGNQVGNALGYAIPTTSVRDRSELSDYNLIGVDLFYLYIGVALVTTLILVIMWFYFEAAPPSAPSKAREISINKDDQYWPCIKRLMRNPCYVHLLISYGLITGIYYAISSLLSIVILNHFPGKQEDAGLIGFVITMTGLVGSVVAGMFLDKTHQFKNTTIMVYILSFIGLVFYTFTMDSGHLWLVYLAAACMGFFMTGYLPVGFDFAVEITYPESEGTSSGLLNCSAQAFGIIFTIMSERIITLYNNDKLANLLMAGCMLLGLVLTFLVKPNYKRQDARKLLVNDVCSSSARSGQVEAHVEMRSIQERKLGL